MANQVRRGGVTSNGVSHQLVQKSNWRTDEGVQTQVPQELITEILLYSSVESLLRFKCVSKSFCTSIDSGEFIDQHYNRSAENKINQKLIVRGRPTERLHVFDVDSDLEERVEKPYTKNPKPYGYCNGVVLFLVGLFRLALWNPSTKQYRNLPPCPVRVPSGSQSSALGMGLGYDSTCDDYKVVLIEDVVTNYYSHDIQVWIFRLRSNIWEMIQDFPYRKANYFVNFGYFANGSLHWLCRGIGTSNLVIVAFDMAKETISEVSQPVHLVKKVHWLITDLHVLDGRLCASYFRHNPDEAGLYVREKDGTDEFTWKELFYVTPEMPLLIDISRLKNFRVLGYLKEGDHKVMLDLGYKFLVLYDLKERSFTTTKIIKLVDGDPKKLYTYPFLCLQSLVPVWGGDFGRKSGQKSKKRSRNSLQQPGEIASNAPI